MYIALKSKSEKRGGGVDSAYSTPMHWFLFLPTGKFKQSHGMIAKRFS